MKTTLELDDALLREAKAVAAKRRTTLRAIVEHALRRELAPSPESNNPDQQRFEVGPLGYLVLKRKPGETISLAQVEAIGRELDDAEIGLAVKHGGRFATFDQNIDASLIPGGPKALVVL